MKRAIVKSLEIISLVIMAIIILGAAISGGSAGGFWGFIGGLVGGGIVAVILMGTLFLLMDIADNTRRTVELLEKQMGAGPGQPSA